MSGRCSSRPKITTAPELAPELLRLAIHRTRLPRDHEKTLKLVEQWQRRDGGAHRGHRMVTLAYARSTGARLEIAKYVFRRCTLDQGWKSWVRAVFGSYESARRHQYFTWLEAELKARHIGGLTSPTQARFLKPYVAKYGLEKTLAVACDGRCIPPPPALKRLLARAFQPAKQRNDRQRVEVLEALRTAIRRADDDAGDFVLRTHVPGLRRIYSAILNGEPALGDMVLARRGAALFRADRTGQLKPLNSAGQ